MKKQLIAFVGLKGSGKSYASYVMANVQIRVTTNLSFAAPIKRLAETAGFPYTYVYGDKKEEIYPPLGCTARKFMQVIGEQCRQEISDEFWLNQWKLAYDEYPGTHLITVDDCRHGNEVALIKELGGVVVGIHRQEVWDAEPDPHPSEQYTRENFFEMCDFIIYNNGSLEDLWTNVEEVCTQWSRNNW